ncbi:MAG: bifunctional metallophosphatase/5'-nucleotidase [Clostridia bacterium]|nr:bifunctional metallophosphatase/5'-nucleotidase [Clostridia bacterium]
MNMKSKCTIYFTSDTHGFLYNTNFVDDQPRPLGLLGMRFPKDENTLIIDGGDTIQGSPLTYFCRAEGEEMPIAAALNARGYDYVTLGNHDFNHGPADLRSYLEALDATCLCANVEGDLPLRGATVHTLGNGLRVGLVGIVTSWVNRWEKPENLQGLRVTDPLEAARRAIKALAGQYDILVGIYHGGIERDLETGRLLSETDENIACKLCEELPFDILLTGHQHIALAEGSWHGVHLVQTPCNAPAYIRAELGEDGKWRSCLVEVSAEQSLTLAEAALRQRMEAWLDRPIGHLSRAIFPENRLTMAREGSAIADFFNRVQLWATGAELSCSSLPNELRGFDADVTVRDVVASYVYSNTLAVLEVTGETLRQALEQCASYFDWDEEGRLCIAEPFLRPKEAHFNYDFFAGLEYRFDLSQPRGQRVKMMARQGKPIQPEDRFTLVMNNYRATGSGDFECYVGCPVLREVQTEVSELIIQYLAEHDTIEIPIPMKIC